MRSVPVRRSSPPTTPFGAWLLRWMEEHPEWTHQAFADEVGVSKGLISQWIGGTVKSVSTVNLSGVAHVTGEPLENLEQMVYGKSIRPATRTPAGSLITLTPEELESLLERAATRAIAKLREEEGHA